MTDRGPLLHLLDRYLGRWPAESAMVARIQNLVVTHEDCLLRTCPIGHITASAWIVSPDHRSFLLTHHAKLGLWLQLGGHVDGEVEVKRAALREAREESGMEHFAFFREAEEILPIDVDVHVIPAHGDEPRHEHHDIRFLLVAAPGQRIAISVESNDLRWFPYQRLAEVAGDSSVVRMGEKARELLARSRAVARDRPSG